MPQVAPLSSRHEMGTPAPTTSFLPTGPSGASGVDQGPELWPQDRWGSRKRTRGTQLSTGRSRAG